MLACCSAAARARSVSANFTLSTERAKAESEVVSEIQAIMRQIASSVGFLPAGFSEDVAFEILIHTAADLSVPSDWEVSEPRPTKGRAIESVPFRSFSTANATVSAQVSFSME
jgi:mitotic spindle assembly checkpoint protein MAD2